MFLQNRIQYNTIQYNTIQYTLSLLFNKYIFFYYDNDIFIKLIITLHNIFNIT
jgi:hypothetical protein